MWHVHETDKNVVVTFDDVSTFTVTHKLSKSPSVQAWDTAGTKIEPNITMNGIESVTFAFYVNGVATAQSGKMILN